MSSTGQCCVEPSQLPSDQHRLPAMSRSHLAQTAMARGLGSTASE